MTKRMKATLEVSLAAVFVAIVATTAFLLAYTALWVDGVRHYQDDVHLAAALSDGLSVGMYISLLMVIVGLVVAFRKVSSLPPAERLSVLLTTTVMKQYCFYMGVMFASCAMTSAAFGGNWMKIAAVPAIVALIAILYYRQPHRTA